MTIMRDTLTSLAIIGAVAVGMYSIDNSSSSEDKITSENTGNSATIVGTQNTEDFDTPPEVEKAHKELLDRLNELKPSYPEDLQPDSIAAEGWAIPDGQTVSVSGGFWNTHKGFINDLGLYYTYYNTNAYLNEEETEVKVYNNQGLSIDDFIRSMDYVIFVKEDLGYSRYIYSFKHESWAHPEDLYSEQTVIDYVNYYNESQIPNGGVKNEKDRL